MKRVLVTGASGFIGRHCLPLLVERGYEIHAVSRTPPTVACARWHQVNLLADAPEPLLRDIRPTHLLHLAWTAVPGKFWTDPDNARWLKASLALARAFAEAGGRRLVCAGSCAEYDWNAGQCIEDRTALAPTTPYASAKHELHAALTTLAAQPGISLAWARVFWLFGPHEHPQRLVPSAVLAMKAGKPFSCLTPELVRDFLHVEDVASGFVALLESDQGGAVNVASGQGTSIGAIVSQISALLHTQDLVRMGAGPARGDAPTVVGDSKRLRATGWKPRHDLASGLADTVHWWQSVPA